MHYSHQAQLSEITGLPVLGESSVTFWTSNAPHIIAARDDAGWSLLESTGSLVGEFVSDNGGFTIVSAMTATQWSVLTTGGLQCATSCAGVCAPPKLLRPGSPAAGTI